MTRPASKTQRASASTKSTRSFRIGRVRAYRRGRIWYLCYREHGRRLQPRVGPEREAARQMAAEVNAQLEVGAPSALGFEPISIAEVRQRWLAHHEHVRRSSLRTISRYRTATSHLMNFIAEVRPLKRISDFRPLHAEEFIRYLRSLRVAPNGHRNAAKRRLRDKGMKYVLEICSTLFNYAARHRHFPPYVENPFRTIEINRIPVEDSRPVTVLTPDVERALLRACDRWQFPIFLTLLLTGLRPGELVHLLVDDLDLAGGWLHVRNKPGLGWKIKTRNERHIPLVAPLVQVLREVVGERRVGPVFAQRRCSKGYLPPLGQCTQAELERHVMRRAGQAASDDRLALHDAAKTVWRDTGALREDWIRIEFKRITSQIGLPELTAPKTLRHTFATTLQDANVDPLVRNELMGHAPGHVPVGGIGLAMTALYTHTRPETKRKQLEAALAVRPAGEVAKSWLQNVQAGNG